MKHRDTILRVLSTGGAYSLEDIRKRCTGSIDANRDVELALQSLVQDGVVETIEGAFRLVRKAGEKQKELF